MSKEQNKLRDEITILLNASNYAARQRIGNVEEEPYEGCVRNLYMILYSNDFDVVIERLCKSIRYARKVIKPIICCLMAGRLKIKYIT